MTHRWEDAEQLLIAAATDDLREVGEVEPALVAFAGATLRFVAWLRPFARGAYHEPLIELLALAVPLDCDRLMLSMSGRVWSLDDSPPADGDGDRRQHAVVIHAVDAAHGPSTSWSALYPVTPAADGAPGLGPRWEPGPAEGWISEALGAAVAQREQLCASWAEIAAQAARVEGLGHKLYVPPDVMTLMAQAGTAPNC